MSKIDNKINILIVDDQPMMGKMLSHILKQIGFVNVHIAQDGVQALEVTRQYRIDLIMTDWNMPKMSGIDLLHAIRQGKATKEIPVIMVTSEGLPENVIKAVREGVDHFIVKPFSADTVRAKIDQVFSKKSTG